MSKPKLEGKILHDVHKVVFYASEYPEKDIKEIAVGFQSMSPIDFNGACWRAQDEGYLSIDKKTGEVKVLRTPDEWQFGESVDHLLNLTPYILTKLAEVEADPEENFYANYVSGYISFDVVIAVRYMLKQGTIASYIVKDVSKAEDGSEIVDEYLFYTLPENVEKRWGEQQFRDQEKLQK